ncbi:hypothetical protein H3221_019965 [Pseudomonas sp. LMG 31766]|uniref:Kazal-like domain-containing protein n=1 Tax=Pseudomonas chaetocerotis TaxID=2758695 RepID=A0A931GBC8_9PSED|nr:hypothetical protein [Pseudomonas chaetocerotis]
MTVRAGQSSEVAFVRPEHCSRQATPLCGTDHQAYAPRWPRNASDQLVSYVNCSDQ